jgi:membrane-associated protein
MPWKLHFLPADGVAVALWALYASGLGYIGGAAFQNNLWLPMLIAAGAGLLVGGLGEVIRRRAFDRRSDRKDRQPARTASAKR